MAHHDGFGPAYVSPDPEYAVTPPGAGHEYTDANVWIIGKFALWLVISALVIHVGLALLFWLFVEQRNAVYTNEYPLATDTGLRLPAEPRLQRFPLNEAAEFRRREADMLETYGWVDRGAGRVRIPIADAMRLTVERGLPFRAPATAAPAAAAPGTDQAAPVADANAAGLEDPSQMPADSSSGRTMERRRQ